MGRLVTTFFTQAENKLVYCTLLEEQCAKGINIYIYINTKKAPTVQL